MSMRGDLRRESALFGNGRRDSYGAHAGFSEHSARWCTTKSASDLGHLVVDARDDVLGRAALHLHGKRYKGKGTLRRDPTNTSSSRAAIAEDDAAKRKPEVRGRCPLTSHQDLTAFGWAATQRPPSGPSCSDPNRSCNGTRWLAGVARVPDGWPLGGGMCWDPATTSKSSRGRQRLDRRW
jgi:hypothetical protein